jgi:hypothetical protein
MLEQIKKAKEQVTQSSPSKPSDINLMMVMSEGEKVAKQKQKATLQRVDSSDAIEPDDLASSTEQINDDQ